MPCENCFCLYCHDHVCELTKISLDNTGHCLEYLPIHLSDETLEVARENTRLYYDVTFDAWP